MSARLPDGFTELEAFAETWAGASASHRAQLRDDASWAEASAFYAAAQPLIEAALARLDAKPLADLDAAEACLLRLLLTFAHVSLAIEVQKQDEAAHSKLRTHLRITRAPADAVSVLSAGRA